MTDFLVDMFFFCGYDIILLTVIYFLCRKLINYWCTQNAVRQNFVDTEMMKLQLDFQRKVRELDEQAFPSSPDNVQ